MSKIKEKATVISQEMLVEGIYSMWIRTEIGDAVAGQFISVYSKDSSKLLPRPISICEVEEGRLRIVYRVVGEGTKEFSSYKEGDAITILGPLGNGYPVAQFRSEYAGRKVLLIGGGIGIPPMLELAKQLKSCADVQIVAGYRNRDELFLTGELESAGELTIATDDGSYGIGGTVIDAIKQSCITSDLICACGPKPMLRGVKMLADEWKVEAYISMEERMACGVGACLGCVCKSTGTDDHSKVNNKRVCKDGPVFPASEVEL